MLGASYGLRTSAEAAAGRRVELLVVISGKAGRALIGKRFHYKTIFTIFPLFVQSSVATYWRASLAKQNEYTGGSMCRVNDVLHYLSLHCPPRDRQYVLVSLLMTFLAEVP